MTGLRAALLLGCALVLAAGEAVVAIHPRSEIPGPRATLGEVADIAAPPEVATRLAAIPVAELPTLTPVRIDAALIRALATRAAGGDGLRIDGEGVAVRRVRTFAASDLAAAAAATLPPGATWSLVRVGSGLSVPDGDGLRLQAESLDPGAVGEVAFRIRALAAAGETGRTLVVLRVELQAEVLVAARAIRRGEAVGPDAVRLERRAVLAARRPVAGFGPGDCAGRVARRDIAAGDMIGPDMVVIPPAVRSGTAVVAVWPGRGFAIEVDATALSDARAGERLSLKRTSDGALLHGVAQPDGTVQIQQ